MRILPLRRAVQLTMPKKIWAEKLLLQQHWNPGQGATQETAARFLAGS
jgi:hypothetical protein